MKFRSMNANRLSFGLKVFCVIPLLMTAANFVIVVKSAVLLKAIHEIDKESMMEVIEQTEGAVSIVCFTYTMRRHFPIKNLLFSLQRSLEDLIRSRVVERITDMSECDDVEALVADQQVHSYKDIDASERINSAMNRIHDPEKKLAELFYQIDKDNSGFLTRCVPLS